MFCNQAKEYLSQKGIAFQERDIAQDPGALADLKKLDYMSTPVIVVNGEVIVASPEALPGTAASPADIVPDSWVVLRFEQCSQPDVVLGYDVLKSLLQPLDRRIRSGSIFF